MSNIEQESARVIHHEDMNDGDPHVSMRAIRVMFNDSKYNYVTDINGTRESIAAYFRGAQLNLSNDPTKDDLQTPVRIEFLPATEDAPTVVIELFEKPYVEWKISRVIGQYGISPVQKAIGTISATDRVTAIHAARSMYRLPWTAKLIAVRADAAESQQQ